MSASRYTLAAITLSALTTGCGGSQPPIGAPGAIPRAPAHIERDGSWMLPEATSDDLLYVTNYSNILVFSYPEDKLVGTLKGFYSSAGDCVDSKGDVFVTDTKPTTVYEYAHGGTKRIASFPTKKAGQIDCAISPTTGDLAISGGIGPAGAYVEIFKQAKGHPVAIEDHSMWFGQTVTYDSGGDIFFLLEELEGQATTLRAENRL